MSNILGFLISIFLINFFYHVLCFMVLKVHSCTLSHLSFTVILRMSWAGLIGWDRLSKESAISRTVNRRGLRTPSPGSFSLNHYYPANSFGGSLTMKPGRNFAWLVSHSISQEDSAKTKLNPNRYSRTRPFGILKISFFDRHCPSYSILCLLYFQTTLQTDEVKNVPCGTR